MDNNSPIVLQPHNDFPVLMQQLANKMRESVAITLEANGVYRNCLTCGFFTEALEICEAFGQRPPARIIAYGCEKHSHAIPF